MTGFILKRLGLALITLWLLSVIVFVLGQVLPSDPGRSVLGPLAAPSAVRALDHQLGVDKPLLTQYWNWITHFPGTSTQYQAAIGPILGPALVRSLKLAVFAFVIVVPLGLIGGDRVGAEGRQADRSDDQHRRPVCPDCARVRFRDHPAGRVLDRAGLASSHGHGAAGVGLLHAAEVLDPAGDSAGFDPVRIHRADGACGNGRGARVRLCADGDVEGPARAGS